MKVYARFAIMSYHGIFLVTNSPVMFLNSSYQSPKVRKLRKGVLGIKDVYSIFGVGFR